MLIALGFSANAAMYIVGNNPFGNWHTYTGVEMTDNGNGVYTYVTDQISGSVWFVFADNLTAGPNDDWNTFNGNYRYGPLNSGETVTAGVEYTTQKSTNGNVSYKFEGTAGQSYQFTFDTNTMKFKVAGYVAPVVIDTYSVAGEPASVFGGEEWSETNTATEMTLVNGLYTWTAADVALTAGNSVKFKIVGNHDWGHAWPADNYVWEVPESGTYDLVFTIDPDTKDVGFTPTKKQDGPAVDPITGDLFLLGNANGNAWHGNVGIEMATTDEDIYTLTDVAFNDSGDGYAYFSFASKLGEDADDWSFAPYRRGAVEDGTLVQSGVQAVLADWGNTGAFKVVPGTYDVEVSLSSDYVVLTSKAEPVEDTYTVAGTENLFGSFWNPADENNDMVLNAETGLYTWTKNNVVFEDVDTIEFKVVKNHDWDVASWPENNWWHRIATAGTYDFVITFNPATEEVNFTATKQGEEPVEDTYTVAGTENLFGSYWNPADENNDMVLDAETGLYTWTKNNVVFEDVDTIEFKVVKNHDWDVASWPENNWWHRIATAGTYDFVITFNPATEEVNFTANKQGGEEPPVEITVYTVVGPEAIFGTNWDATDENNDMTLEDGVYTWSKENVELTNNFGFKVVGNHDYAVYEWPMGYENNWIATVETPGIYTIEITFDPEEVDTLRIACTLTKTGDIEPVHYDGDVYIMGEVNGNSWATNVGVQMERDAENNVYTATITTAGENVPENEEIGYSYFSFTKQLAETADDWDGIAPYRFGAVSEGDFLVTEELLGQELSLEMGGDAYKIVAGTWDLTLDVDNMTLVIKKQGLRGDVNGDKLVNITDAIQLINAILSSNFETINYANSDVTGEGQVNITDAIQLINFISTGHWYDE